MSKGKWPKSVRKFQRRLGMPYSTRLAIALSEEDFFRQQTIKAFAFTMRHTHTEHEN